MLLTMDPVSLAFAIPPVVILCASAVRELRSLVESMKTANKTLLRLLNRAERMRLFLDALRGLASQLKDPEHEKILLTFGENDYKNTLRSIEDLVRQVSVYSSTPIKLKAYWVTQKHKAVALVKTLQEHEAELVVCLTLISTKASISGNAEVHAIKATIGRQAQIQDKFKAMSIDDQDLADDETLVEEETPEFVASNKIIPIWPGLVIRGHFDEVYVEARDRVADAAYWGDWQALEEALLLGVTKFGENWGNSVRLKPGMTELSFWTPLHQAALFGAPIEVVRMIQTYGGLRLQRTRWADDIFPYRDLVAEEIAREMGFIDVARTLAPVIYHPVPHRVLAILQESLHRMIREDSKGHVWGAAIVLPDLNVLTELEDPDMWFPVGDGAGYRFCLDSRELIVSRVGIGVEPNIFRITADCGSWPVKRAVMFNR